MPAGRRAAQGHLHVNTTGPPISLQSHGLSPSHSLIMLAQHLILSLFVASSRALTAAQTAPVEEYDVLQYVDPLIGSANGGR